MKQEINAYLGGFGLSDEQIDKLTNHVLALFAERVRGIEVKSRVTPHDFDVMDLEGRMELCEPIPTELLPLQLAQDEAKAKREGWLGGFADFQGALLKELGP